MTNVKEKTIEYILSFDLSMFDGNLNPNSTNSAGLSDEMKTFYSDYMIDLAQPLLVHDQFGIQADIPKNKGKSIEFRKYDNLPKALTPLTDGVTPDGQSLNMSVITSNVNQFGAYVTVTDMLQLAAIDNNIVEATDLVANQAGMTLDTVTREVINGGTNVQYAEGQVSHRYSLVGGDSTASNNHYMTTKAVRNAVRLLKVMNAPKINGYYVAIVHPDVTTDLKNDKLWEAVKTYDPKDLYEGEIGRFEGVRFVETTEAKIFHAKDLLPLDGTNLAVRNLTVASVAAKVFTVDEAISTAQALALAGRKLIIKGVQYTVDSAAAGAAGAATVTVLESVTGSPADGDIIYPGEAGSQGRDVYSTLFLGAKAYGTTKITGGGLQHIIKQLGSGGTADPLDQRATVGWKATKTATRLVEQYMVRVETASEFEAGEN